MEEVVFGLTALFAGGILSRSQIISRNINTIIVIVLFGLVFVQVLKI